MEKPLVKMIIESFPERNFQGDPLKFILPVNPESFSKNFKVEYDTQGPAGTQGTSARFNSTAPEEFRIEFILDGTNTIEGYDYGDIKKDQKKESEVPIGDRTFPKEDLVELQLKKFLETVYHMDGEIHRPRFCVITWGGQLFRGILSSLDVNYALFHPTGKPLRIKLNASFLDYIAQDERERRSNLRSPDLTRIKQVKAGDRLDKMVSDVYGDPKFVIQVAKANGLTSFRQIQPGTEVRLPPLDKTEVV
jgi:hypothetical protein